MVEANTYLQPRVYINNNEILDEISGSVTFTGNNQVNSLKLKISNPDIQHHSLMDKNVKLYLNNGSIDSAPFFSGIITQIKPDASMTNITAMDPRILISGKNGHIVELTDNQNYDGYTLGAFLYSFISNKVNNNETRLGLDMLTDTYPTVSMTGQRQSQSVYGLAKKILKTAVDDDDFLNPLPYFFDIIEHYDAPQLVIKKDKLLSSTPAMTFSYADGLQGYSFTRRTPVNTATYTDGTFQYTNRPTGDVVTSIKVGKKTKLSRAELRNVAIQQVLLEQQRKDEIKITVSKGHDIGIGSIIRLNVPDDDISGNHRVVGKTIAFGKRVTCSLKLNKNAPQIRDYLQKS
tara:strand:- start:172 stop:1212 length:1041 start_codon:yes stop_codon:yes gene_type:complete